MTVGSRTDVCFLLLALSKKHPLLQVSLNSNTCFSPCVHVCVRARGAAAAKPKHWLEEIYAQADNQNRPLPRPLSVSETLSDASSFFSCPPLSAHHKRFTCLVRAPHAALAKRGGGEAGGGRGRGGVRMQKTCGEAGGVAWR